MSYIDTKIVGPLNNNYVKVEVSSKKTAPIYYKVPKDNADKFCKDYEKYVKKADNIANLTMGVSMLAGYTAIVSLAKNFNMLTKTILGIAGGIATGAGVTYFTMNNAEKKHNNFIKKYGVENLYDKKQSMANIIAN